MEAIEKIECNICNKFFTTKSSLLYHQRTTKYCLTKQGIYNENFKCQYCDKILSTRDRLNTHSNTCKIKYKNIVNDDITIYKNKIESCYSYIPELKKMI